MRWTRHGRSRVALAAWLGLVTFVGLGVAGANETSEEPLQTEAPSEADAPAVPAEPVVEPASVTASAAELMLELRIERAELERRAFALEGREQAVAEAERELQRRIDEFEVLRDELERRFDQLEEAMGDEVARLSKTYAAMPPDKAATLITQLDTELASSILRRMRTKQSAAVLAGMAPEHARVLSVRLAKPFSRENADSNARRPRRGGQR